MSTPGVANSSPPRSRTRWLAMVLLQTLVFGGLFFGVAELASRYLGGFQPLTPADFIFEPHPRWGWHHRVNAEGTFVKLGFQTPIRINSHGLREREIGYEKAPGVFRVLVLGDSNVAGFEVQDDETFVRVTESLLRDKGYNVEFVNAGHRGFGTDQSLLFLMDEGMKYHPDLVLYFWSDNDLDDNITIHRPYRKYGKAYFELDENGGVELHGVPVPEFAYTQGSRVGEDGQVKTVEVPAFLQATLWVRDRLITRSAFGTFLVYGVAQLPNLEKFVLGGSTFGDFQEGGGLTPQVDEQSRMFRLTLALVREMQRVAAEGGAQVQMIGIPSPWPIAIRAKLGMPELREYALYWEGVTDRAAVKTRFDPHWNALGNRLYAEQLAEALIRGGLVPQHASEAPHSGSTDGGS
jgi:hypothetical protein